MFGSDNMACVCPEIMGALVAINKYNTPSYGNDAISTRMRDAFCALFETEVNIFPVATGTAANALSLSFCCPPWGVIFCHEGAHIAVDECGAPELYTGGGKLVQIPGPHGRLLQTDVEAAIMRFPKGDRHSMQPSAVSITQITEVGTVYSIDEVSALSATARRHGLGFHMDGARLANAIVALECSPADITWKAGVDVLSFGATKNGAMAAEAVVLFQTGRSPDLKDAIHIC